MTRDEHDLYTEFRQHTIGDVRAADYCRALAWTVDELMARIPAHGGPRRKTAKAYAEARESAADLLRTWYDQGAEMAENRSADHVAAHRPGAVWARFLYWDHRAARPFQPTAPQPDDTPCEFTQQDGHEWHCTTHDVTMVQKHEPNFCTAGVRVKGGD